MEWFGALINDPGLGTVFLGSSDSSQEGSDDVIPFVLLITSIMSCLQPLLWGRRLERLDFTVQLPSFVTAGQEHLSLKVSLTLDYWLNEPIMAWERPAKSEDGLLPLSKP